MEDLEGGEGVDAGRTSASIMVFEDRRVMCLWTAECG